MESKSDVLFDFNIAQELNSKKVFIDKELWYIPDFLSQDEFDYLEPFCNDPTGWYITSRSESIRNKFPGTKIKMYPEGTICPTRGIDLSNSAMFPDDPYKERDPRFFSDNGVFPRMKLVLPETLNDDLSLQSFWPIDIEENPIAGGGAYYWHFEKQTSKDPEFVTFFDDSGMTAAWSLYLNDDFEGGELEFLYKPYKIKPKKGMLISIPMTEDFTHRVTPVTKGIRHTMYGTCYLDPDHRPLSTGENC
jgi:hypothetical protein